VTEIPYTPRADLLADSSPWAPLGAASLMSRISPCQNFP
jgi:hypothetical protein